jgi:hypothetical protein
MTNEQIDSRRSELQKRGIELRQESKDHRLIQDELFKKLAENNAIIERCENDLKEIERKLVE